MTNDQGQTIVNSDAVRARNARKRAKLKAKARGESPHAYSFRMVAKTRDIWAEKAVMETYPACPFSSRYTTWNSATINSTGFELTDHGREYIRAFCQSLTAKALMWTQEELAMDESGNKAVYQTPRQPSSVYHSPFYTFVDHFSVFIIRDGEERSTSWQDVTDVETLAAEVEAAFLQ